MRVQKSVILRKKLPTRRKKNSTRFKNARWMSGSSETKPDQKPSSKKSPISQSQESAMGWDETGIAVPGCKIDRLEKLMAFF